MKFTVEEKSVKLLNELLPLLARRAMPFPYIKPNDQHGFTLLWEVKHNSNTIIMHIQDFYEIHTLPSEREEQRTQKTDDCVMAFVILGRSINELDLYERRRYSFE